MRVDSTAGPFRVFRRPSFQEFINTTMSACRFCGSPVDAKAAKAAVDAQTKLNAVCSGTTSIMTFAGLMLLLSVVSCIGACIGRPINLIVISGGWAGFGMLLVPFMIIGLRRRIKLTDRPEGPAIQRARRSL